jgi:hypothetical protein
MASGVMARAAPAMPSTSSGPTLASRAASGVFKNSSARRPARAAVPRVSVAPVKSSP